MNIQNISQMDELTIETAVVINLIGVTSGTAAGYTASTGRCIIRVVFDFMACACRRLFAISLIIDNILNWSLSGWNSSSLLRCKRSNLDHFQVDLDAS